jgi:transposase
MGPEHRKTYSKEFKEQAVELAETSGKPIYEIAKDLGIHHSVLSRWCREKRENGSRSFPGQGNRQPGTELEEEILKLKKELHTVTMERDILKKAVAIFSQTEK